MLLSGGGDSRLSCENKTDTWDVEQVQVQAFTHRNTVSAGFSSFGCFHIWCSDDDDLSAPTLFIYCFFEHHTYVYVDFRLLLQVVAITKPSLIKQYSFKLHMLSLLYLQDKPLVPLVLHIFIWEQE